MLEILAAVAKLIFALFELVSGDAPGLERLPQNNCSMDVHHIILPVIILPAVFGGTPKLRSSVREVERRLVSQNDLL